MPSNIISKVLSPAVKLWLRSQVETVDRLRIEINGSDRQIIGGYIPNIFLASSSANYQGIHFSEVELVGNNIRINIGQIIKGKPLRLIEPISVIAKVMLQETDLNRSLSSPLLSAGLTDFFFDLLATRSLLNLIELKQDFQIQWLQLAIEGNKLIIEGNLINSAREDIPLTIISGLTLANPQTLLLHSLKIETIPGLINMNLNEFQLDLGSVVAIEELSLLSDRLNCYGRLTVLP